MRETLMYGGDLHPYHRMPASEHGTQMGHDLGVVEEFGSEVIGLKKDDLVAASFAFQDNTCEFCREGVQTSCRHGGFFSEAQAELIRVPQAAGTLVKLPVGEDSALLPSLVTLADVYGTGYHAAKRANVNSRTTVTRRARGQGRARPGARRLPRHGRPRSGEGAHPSLSGRLRRRPARRTHRLKESP